MRNVWNAKYGWAGLLLLLVGINILSAVFHYRLDLTREKRFTLSDATVNLLQKLDEPLDITVFLAGDMPAGFKKLANSSEELLQEFRVRGNKNISFRFEKPGAGMSDSAKSIFLDSLHALGLQPLNVKAQTREGEGREEQFIYPGAFVSYRGRATAIDFLQGQSAVEGINSLNNAEALLEYKFASAVNKLSLDSLPLVGYLTGNGESVSYNVYDLVNTVKANFHFNFLPIDQVPLIPSIFDALLIVKPTLPFSDEQKLKIDQYVMNGGKVIWMIDNLYAEFDSLQRSQNEFIAFDRGLRLEDQLFRYGVRINPDLVQDQNSDVVPTVVGSIGGKPQIELLQWPYFPLLSNTGGHPIAKNLDYVVSEFPNSMDTVKAEAVKKTYLLVTSPYSKVLASPAKVSFPSVQTQEDINSFTAANIPVAILLEGKFSSIFANRLAPETRDSLAKYGSPFQAVNREENKMIVVSDGDIALNAVTQKEGPLTMGKNRYTGYQYANREFLMNCVEYLTDNSGILQARGKDYTLRLLDKKQVAEQRSTWQFVNIVLPVGLVVLAGAVFSFLRKRRWTGNDNGIVKSKHES